MVDFQSPQVLVRETRTGPVAAPSVSPGVAAFMGICEKGPVNDPQEVFGPGEATELFGSFVTGSYLMDAVNHFFNNGGERCFINRIAHYTDIADAATLTALAATTMHQTTSSPATSGSVTSDAASFPAVLPAGTFVDGEVDAGAVAGFTIAATAATKTGTGGTFAAGAGGDSVTITIDGVPGSQVIDLSSAGANVASYLVEINTQLVGGYAIDDGGGEIQLVTDQKGSGAGGSIDAFGGAAAAKTGLATGAFTNAGPNNVADDRAVTAAEFASLMDGGFPGSTSTAVGTDRVQWASDTTGAASSVQFTSPASIATLIPGFDLSLHSGSALGAGVNTLLVSASSPGAWGNLERVTSVQVDTTATTVAATSAGAASSLTVASTARLRVGDTISVTKAADTQRSVITSVDPVALVVQLSPSITVPAGGYAGTEGVVLETFDLAAIDKDGVTEFTFRDLRMSSLAGSRYVENVINNTPRSPISVTDQGASIAIDNRPTDVASSLLGQTQAGTDGGTVVDTDYTGNSGEELGLYAFDDNDDFLLGPMIPGVTSSAVQLAQLAYCEGRKDIFTILETPQGLTPTAAKTYVQTTANLASSFGAIYYPWLRDVDPRTSGPASFPNVGYVSGMYARVFAERNFGKAPAGIQDGRLRSPIGVDTEVKKAQYDILYPAKINAIQKKRGAGIAVMGSRTLDPLGDFLQINARIVFLVVRRVFQEGTQFALFETNNDRTRARVSRFMTLYLRGLREAGVLDGNSDAEAFYVVCDRTNNTAAVQSQGKLVCRVGLNVGKTIEFIDITLEQDTRALDAEVASEIG